MRTMMGVGLLVSAGLMIAFSPQLLHAQSCKDEEAMVVDAEKTLTDLVDTVKKESLEDFQSKFHQKSSMSKLRFSASMVDALVSCLDQASKDASATKEQSDAYKAKHDTYSKLKDKLTQNQNALKATEVPKEAKALVEKFTF